MISHERRCIFVHIPKTGGTSIEDAIWGPDRENRRSDMLWMGGGDPTYEPYVRSFGPLQHLRARDIQTLVGHDVFDDYFRFTVVRNPWDRLVSQYHHFLASPSAHRVYDLPADATFDAYVEGLAGGAYTRHCQSLPQWHFVFDDRNQQLVDSIGRFEHLSLYYEQIALRLAVNAALPHQMKSAARKPTADYFSDTSTRRRTNDLYGEDVERFGYRFPEA